jgi:hypothetical protein
MITRVDGWQSSDEEYFQMWEQILDKNNMRSIVPVSDYFSRDMTEASLMLDFWINNYVIVPKTIN